jgi:hypothetical protein
MIKTSCPSCFQQYEVEESAVGTYVDCPSCGKRFRVQAAQPAGAGDGSGSRQPKRLSMTLALVFQCILIGGALLHALMWLDGDNGAVSVLSLLFFVPAILCIVFSCMLHHKCWAAMPEGFGRLTPGKAVGYMFIPFYNLYWVFPSFAGLGSDCVALAKAKGFRGHDSIAGLGMGLAVVMCVEMVLGWYPALGLLLSAGEFVLWILFYQGVTKLLNRVAATAE